MQTGIVERFTSRLQECERTRNPEVLVPLFADESELRRLPQRHAYQGHDGAREFWREYLDTFESVHTDFDAVTEAEGRAALEWHSTCRLRGGSEVRYAGCTIIESEGDRVVSLRTYYDSAVVLGHRLQPHA